MGGGGSMSTQCPDGLSWSTDAGHFQREMINAGDIRMESEGEFCQNPGNCSYDIERLFELSSLLDAFHLLAIRNHCKDRCKECGVQ